MEKIKRPQGANGNKQVSLTLKLAQSSITFTEYCELPPSHGSDREHRVFSE